MVRLPPTERIGPLGPVRVERTVKLLPVGAISISIHVPFEVDHIEDLVVYHDLEFSNGSLQEEVRRLADEIRKELAPWSLKPNPKLEDEEAYTVFCLDTLRREGGERDERSEDWLAKHRRKVAALLTQEPDGERLSLQESDESTNRYLSYYQSDLLVIDWDSALLIDEEKNFDETLYILELANVQLAELEAYDRLLDDALERAYRDLAKPIRNRPQVIRELRELRIDLSRFSDELSNITKFFGDWHLARIYQNISARFHLTDWHRTLDDKLKTLDELYQLLQHEQNNRVMLILEVMIVLLFVLDLVMLGMGMKK